jgi:serine/threonine protein kinase
MDQVAELLDVLALLHRRGICHGDITPGNVFVDGDRLLLGDLGIAKQGLLDGPVGMDGKAPKIFLPPDAKPFYWSASEDIYQLGLIALSLLAGEVVTSQEVCTRLLKTVKATDHVKGWIRDAVSTEPDRFQDASEALTVLRDRSIKPAPAPRSLKDQKVVFTGVLPMTRATARQRAAAKGATFPGQVNGATTLIVAGQPNPLQIGQRAGTKLFDAHRRIRRGQRIAIINARQFDRLLAKASKR